MQRQAKTKCVLSLDSLTAESGLRLDMKILRLLASDIAEKSSVN